MVKQGFKISLVYSLQPESAHTDIILDFWLDAEKADYSYLQELNS